MHQRLLVQENYPNICKTRNEARMRSMKNQRIQAFEKFTHDCLKNHKFQIRKECLLNAKNRGSNRFQPDKLVRKIGNPSDGQSGQSGQIIVLNN